MIDLLLWNLRCQRLVEFLGDRLVMHPQWRTGENVSNIACNLAGEVYSTQGLSAVAVGTGLVPKLVPLVSFMRRRRMPGGSYDVHLGFYTLQEFLDELPENYDTW